VHRTTGKKLSLDGAAGKRTFYPTITINDQRLRDTGRSQGTAVLNEAFGETNRDAVNVRLLANLQVRGASRCSRV